MANTTLDYVHQTAEGGWRIADSRISLDSVVLAYWDGKSPEVIANEFPTLSIEQIYGAITFYLQNRQEIDRYLAEQDAIWQKFAETSERENSELLQRLRKFRAEADSK